MDMLTLRKWNSLPGAGRLAVLLSLVIGSHVLGEGGTPYFVYTNLAGLPGTSGPADGTGTAARFNGPFSTAVDPAGNIFVADYMNHAVRKITPAGVVTTFAGLAGASGSADGTGSAARFTGLQGVAADSAGNVYVSDTFNSTIRKITPAGVVTTLAGLAGATGTADGTGSAARFYYPAHLAVDSWGNIYVAEYWQHTIRKITPAGVVSTFAGTAGSAGSADGTGAAARFNNPNGVAVDSGGNVYVTDRANNTIRKITPDGVVTTLAGLAGSAGSADGTNITARFSAPYGVGCYTNGDVFVADSGNHTIRKVTSAGVVTTIGGLAGTRGTADGTNTAARFNSPSGVATDSAGNLYIADWQNQRVSKGTLYYPPAPVITATNCLPSGTTGQAYNQVLTATGGTTPYTWTLISGSLPPGLSLSTGGTISGIPSAATNASFTVRVIGANAAYATTNLTLSTFTPPSILTASPLPGAISGSPYTTALVGSGATLPYTWELTAGSLPAGLSLSPNGLITGTPTAMGGSSFNIRMTAGTGLSVTNTFNLAVNQGVPLTEGFECGAAMPAGWTQEFVVDTASWVFQKGGHGSPANPHSGALNALLWSGATSDHKTRLITPMIDFGTNTAGQLTFWVDTKVYYLYQDNLSVYYRTSAVAPWILLGSRSYTSWTQVQMDLPTPSRTYYIAFEGNARGGYGVCLDDVSIIAVAPPSAPAINSLLLPSGTVCCPYSQSLTASGGKSPYAWAIASGSLPSGLSLSSGGVISGIPVQRGSSDFAIKVTGSDGYASTNQFSLAINPVSTASNPTYSFTTFVGGSFGFADGTNRTAQFSAPVGVCLDATNCLFVGDSWNHLIRKIAPNGVVTTLAGLAQTPGTNDGVGSAARFSQPYGVAVDSYGQVYVADKDNATIRLVTPGGSVCTLAGTAGHTGIDLDDPDNWYYFWEPYGVAVKDGACYVADTENNVISKITPPNAYVSIVAGFYEGSNDGTYLSAQFRWPEGLALDQAGNIFVADTANCTVRKITPDKVVTTCAGTAGLSGGADGTNSAARFSFPAGIAVDRQNNLFVCDRGNHTIRRITPDGVVTTIGGLAGVAGNREEVGLAARFHSPSGIAVDGNGVLYIADTSNNRIVKGTPIQPAAPLQLQSALQAGHFRMTMTGPSNWVVVVEACTNLLNPFWTTLQTNTLVNGAALFEDAQPAASQTRKFYRIRSP